MITQAQKDYFKKTRWGSYEGYVSAQRARYLKASNKTPSDFADMALVEADAKRLFYSLPSVITNGGVQGMGGGNNGNIVNLPNIINPDASGTGNAGSSGIINPDAAGTTGASIGDGIGAALSKISLNNFLVIVGVVFGFLILRKAVRAVK